jgi:hypothetical protein
MANKNRHEWRDRSRLALERYFERHSFPKLMLSLILCVTGVAGFGISYELLHLGVHAMWIRYPLATLGAYIFCLGMLRIWAEFERRRFKPEHLEADARPIFRPLKVQDDRSSSWTEWIDFGDFNITDDRRRLCIGVCSSVG